MHMSWLLQLLGQPGPMYTVTPITHNYLGYELFNCSPSSNAYWQSWQLSWPLHLNCVPEENAPGGNGSVTLVQVLRTYIYVTMTYHSIIYNLCTYLPCKKLCWLEISCRKAITRIRYYSMCNRHPRTVSRIWNVLNLYSVCTTTFTQWLHKCLHTLKIH